MELHYGLRMNVCGSASNMIRALALTGKKGMRSQTEQQQPAKTERL